MMLSSTLTLALVVFVPALVLLFVVFFGVLRMRSVGSP
jgi:hypothetical protein